MSPQGTAGAGASRVMPVTIVTGALGAGKTTVVNVALRAAKPLRLGVIVNEFGDIGLDGYLLGDGPDTMLELNSGCLCCSVRGELDAALARMARDDVDEILVETTGIADPGPVIESVTRRPDLLMLDAVVCVVDARNFFEQVSDPRHPEIARQVELASAIALTKTELAGPERTREVREHVTALNPVAELHLATHGALPLPTLLNAEAFAPEPVLDEIHPDHEHHSAPYTHHHAAHRHHHHGGIEAISVQLDGDLNLDQLTDWLYATIAFKGRDLNRIKGILAIEEQPNRVLIHGVQGYLQIATGPAWNGERRRSTIVVIGHNLDPALWRLALEGCQTRSGTYR